MKTGVGPFLIMILCLQALTIGGCSTFGQRLKRFLGGEPASSPAAPPQPKLENSFSKNSNYSPPVRRHYQHVTKEMLANENNLGPQAGSLWVMEGQGGFLFSQNIIRMIGDPLAVKIDGEPKQQLQAKANVIQDLLNELAARRARLRGPASTAAPVSTNAKDTTNGKVAAKKAPTKTKSPFNVKIVPTRITERLVDGNYRVKGSQPFMIGSREYKVIVTGIVRAEDFSDDGLSASKLLDPKFDIVSTRKRD